MSSPAKRPASARTPTGKEGLLLGAIDSANALLGVADEEYTVIDCESSVTALDMVQLSLDKQGLCMKSLYLSYVTIYGKRDHLTQKNCYAIFNRKLIFGLKYLNYRTHEPTRVHCA